MIIAGYSSCSTPDMAEASGTNANAVDTGVDVLSQRGIQDPNAAPGVKYSYWTGAEIVPSRTGLGSTHFSSISGNGSAPTYLIGRLTGYNTSVTYGGGTGIPGSVTITWAIQSSGDIKISCN